MSYSNEGLLKAIDQELESKKQHLEEVRKVIELIPDELYEIINDKGYIGIGEWVKVYAGIPWDVELEEAAIKALEEAGFVEIDAVYLDQHAKKRRDYNHPDTGNTSTFHNDFDLYIEAQRTGSKCEIVEAGTKEMTIYEVNCGENV